MTVFTALLQVTFWLLCFLSVKKPKNFGFYAGYQEIDQTACFFSKSAKSRKAANL